MKRNKLILERYIYSAWQTDDGIGIYADNFGRYNLLEKCEFSPAQRVLELDRQSYFLDTYRIAQTQRLQIWSCPIKAQANDLFSLFVIQTVLPDRTGDKWNYIAMDILRGIAGYIESSDLNVSAFSGLDPMLRDLAWQLVI